MLLGTWGAALAFWGALAERADLSASGERGVHAATCFALIAVVGLGWALAVGDLTYRYVASWTSSATPLPYRIGAVWAGPSGALLVWAFALGVGTSIAAATLRRGSTLRAWTVALLALLLVAVLVMATFETPPFARLAFPPDDGRGLPLEWMRPIVLLQMPLGYVAMALVSVPSIMTVMGALGSAPWRDSARRWALICWALLGAAMLLDWRRRYGDAAWSEGWRWAPVHAGTAFAWAGATLLVLATSRRWRSGAAVTAGFIAFTLGLGGLTLRRASGWDGVADFAATLSGRAAAWTAFVLVVAASVEGLRAAPQVVSGLAARALRTSHAAVLAATAALVAAGVVQRADLSVREGERVRTADRFGTPWTLSLEGVSTVGREAVVANVVAVRAAVKGRARAFVTAEVRSLYVGEGREAADQIALSGIAPGLAQDLRVDVREANTADALLTVQFIPGASWLWIAGVVAVLAALVSAFARLPALARDDATETAGASVGDAASGAAPGTEGA